MSWNSRAKWGVMVLGVGGSVVALAVTIQHAPAAGDDTSPSPGVVGPIDRNCWDPTQWGPRPQPDCQDPDDAGRKPAPEPKEKSVDRMPVFVSHDLTSNRGHTLPTGTLQVITFYDGDISSRPILRIEYTSPRTGLGWIDVTNIRASTSNKGRIDTFEYSLGAAQLTGRFEITGVMPNGVIDGLAFGLFWRDARGFRVLRSTAPDPRPYAALVGAWPIGLNDKSFERRTPQLLSGAARQQARMALYGAEYLDNGVYLITIQERAVELDRRVTAE